mgnify:CR=1 FL=1
MTREVEIAAREHKCVAVRDCLVAPCDERPLLYGGRPCVRICRAKAECTIPNLCESSANKVNKLDLLQMGITTCAGITHRDLRFRDIPPARTRDDHISHAPRFGIELRERGCAIAATILDKQSRRAYWRLEAVGAFL